ncbi:hypothetical protein [Streptomyces sp. NPDC050428]|uniref:DUF6197 family protein n=1 Tax=Streptomyces sp. NPDC050428 TaxID=3155757 RepID=UPI00342AE64A
MTTATAVKARPPTGFTAAVDLETRLALADAAMSVRLDQALLAFDVSTAHLPDTVVELPSAPILPAAAPEAHPAGTPLADCFERARSILATRGWVRGALRSDQGAVCAIGALRAAATSRHQADDAAVLLLDVIQQEFADAGTVPSWNDAQTSAGPVLRILGQAAALANSRNL